MRFPVYHARRNRGGQRRKATDFASGASECLGVVPNRFRKTPRDTSRNQSGLILHSFRERRGSPPGPLRRRHAALCHQHSREPFGDFFHLRSSRPNRFADGFRARRPGAGRGGASISNRSVGSQSPLRQREYCRHQQSSNGARSSHSSSRRRAARYRFCRTLT